MGEKLSADDLEGAEEVKAPAGDDPDLAFLKPGYRRPAAAAPAAGEKLSADDLEGAEEVAPPVDRVGRAARAYTENTAALAARQPGTAPAAAGPAPDVSGAEALGRGALQGASLGWQDEVAAAADAAIAKVPGVRNAAEYLADKAGGRGASLDYTNPNLTYADRRDAYRRLNDAAQQQHGKLYGTGEVLGGLATAAGPGMSLAKGAGALEVGGQGALLGTAAGAGESKATDAGGVARDALESGAAGGIGGAVLHPVASKVVGPLATKALARFAGKTADVADSQAIAQLTRDAPESLTRPITMDDAEVRAAINEPIQVGPKKTTTLRDIAGKSAEEVRPVIQAKQAEVDQKIAELHGKSGEPNLADLTDRYDSKIASLAKNPENEKAIRQLEQARQETLNRWGPSEADRKAKLDEIGEQTGKIYGKSDVKTGGGAELGDMVQHWNNDIDVLSKDPSKVAYVRALEKTRDNAVKAWGSKPVFDPNAVVEGGSFGGAKAGDAVAKLQKMAASAGNTPGEGAGDFPEYEGDVFHTGLSRLTNIDPQKGLFTADSIDESVPYINGNNGFIHRISLKEGAQIAGQKDMDMAARAVLADEPKTGYSGVHYNKDVRDYLRDKGFDAVRFNDIGPDNKYEHQTTLILNPAMADIEQTAPVHAGKIARYSQAPAGRNGDVYNALTAEADRIRAAATKNGFDPTVKIPAEDVRGYVTYLQNEAETGSDDPNVAGKARKFLGATTKNFINQHVGNTVGLADQKALEALNKRTSNILRWDDVVAGNETNPDVRRAVLGEFGGQKISPQDLDTYASALEERGKDGIAKLTPGETAKAKATKGSVTRDYADEHSTRNLSPEDAAELDRQMGLRTSLKNIDDTVSRRLGKERADKIGIKQIIGHAMAASPGITEIGHGMTKILAGDVGAGLGHVGTGVALAGTPLAVSNARAIGRGVVRSAADHSANLLASVMGAADAGNPWARRQIDLLRQAPGGAARLAAAVARMKGGGGTTGAGEAP